MSNKLKNIILISFFAVILGGCAGAAKLVTPDANQSYQAKKDKALVIFMRSSFVGGAISSTVVDVTNDDPKLVAAFASGHKVAHYTDAGKHMYMVVGENGDFLEADLEAGKIYYAIVTPRMGFWKARFSLHPLKLKHPEEEFMLDSEELREWLADTKFIQPNEKAAVWFEKNKPSISQKLNEYIEKWNNKSEEDKDEFRLAPEDGVVNPIS